MEARFNLEDTVTGKKIAVSIRKGESGSSLLISADGYDSGVDGSYIAALDFWDSKLRMLSYAGDDPDEVSDSVTFKKR